MSPDAIEPPEPPSPPDDILPPPPPDDILPPPPAPGHAAPPPGASAPTPPPARQSPAGPSPYGASPYEPPAHGSPPYTSQTGPGPGTSPYGGYGASPFGPLPVSYQPGMGQQSLLPPELQGWNWGAFFFDWIWGVFNGAYATLWIFLVMWLPFGGSLWAIVCGTKGNEWAWRGKQWESVQHFKDVQRKWAIAALVCFLVLAAFVVLMIIVGALTPDTTTTTYD